MFLWSVQFDLQETGLYSYMFNSYRMHLQISAVELHEEMASLLPLPVSSKSSHPSILAFQDSNILPLLNTCLWKLYIFRLPKTVAEDARLKVIG